MNSLKCRLFYLLIANLALVFASSNEAMCQSRENGESPIRFVAKDTQFVVLIRPRQLMESEPYRQVAKNNPNLNLVVKRLTRDWFKVGLAEFQDIDYLLQMQNRVPDQRSHEILVLNTNKDHADGFELATHSVKQETEFNGKTIVESKKPLMRIYNFSSIFDDKTIIWGNSREAIETAIDAGLSKSIAVDWYKPWSQFEEHVIVFALIPKAAEFPPAPHPLTPFSEVEQIFGGVELSSEVTVTIRAVCPSTSKAKEIFAATESALPLAKQQINSGMVEDGRSFEQVASRVMLKLIDAAKVGHNGKIVTLNSKAKIDFDSIVNGFDEILGASKRTEAANNLRQEALAMHNYHATYGRFPPSVLTHESGKKYSWRIAILPFIEQQDIYDRYDFTQDWDSPHNLEVTADMPDAFRSDSDDEDSTNASFFMLTGPGGMFEGETALNFADVVDGTSNTVMAVEAKRDVHWAKPEDITVMPGEPFPKLGGFHEGGFNVTMADGSVRFLSEDVAEETLRRLFLVGDGHVIDPEAMDPKPGRE